MTLVLTCTTRSFALQVSDRRLTVKKANGSYGSVDDNSNKVIFVNGWLFAYTGLAQLEGLSTVEWFLQILKPHVDAGRMGEGFAEVQGRLDRELKRLVRTRRLPPEFRRHTFVGVGWMNIPAKSRRPTRVTIFISNQHDKADASVLHAPIDDVLFIRFRLNSARAVSLMASGVQPPRDELTRLHRQLRRPYYSENAENCARLLAISLARFSTESWTHDTVGRNVTVASLPLAALLQQDRTMGMGLPNGVTATSCLIPGEGPVTYFETCATLYRGMPALLSLGVKGTPPHGSDPYLGWRLP